MVQSPKIGEPDGFGPVEAGWGNSSLLTASPLPIVDGLYSMLILALKLILTPLLIAMATLVGRRWGSGISGWLVGFPLTSGPVSFILAWQEGRQFAGHAAVGSLGGQGSFCLFCLTYALLATKLAWPATSCLALGVFVLSTLLWSELSLPLLPTIVILLSLIVGTSVAMPRCATDKSADSPKPPRWDLPMRMLIATGFVVALTTAASALGPRLSGLLSPFPIFATVLAVFTHRAVGAGATVRMMRGMVIGSLGFAGFFVAVAYLLPGWPIGWTYLLGTALAIGVNGISLVAAR
jgi:hypothetical protein